MLACADCVLSVCRLHADRVLAVPRYELEILELIMGDNNPAHSELEIRSIISQHDTALRQTFVRYRDPKTGHLQMTGFIKFCTDAQVTICALPGSLCCRISDRVLTCADVC